LLPLCSAEYVSASQADQAIACHHELSETISFDVWRVALESFPDQRLSSSSSALSRVMVMGYKQEQRKGRSQDRYIAYTISLFSFLSLFVILFFCSPQTLSAFD
jgi:hypothetical protein